MAESVETRVRALSSEGAGIGALPDGRVLFVQRTAPGDLVEAEVTIARKRWARGRLRSVLQAADTRIEPECPLFDRCGGCALQHLPYDAELEWKARWIADALERIGGLPTEIPAVVPSPLPLRYRRRMSYTLLRLRGGRVVAGLHELGDTRRIVDIGSECLLPEPVVAAAWNGLREAWGRNAERLPSGPRLRLTLRATQDGVGLWIQGGRKPGEPEALVEAVEPLVSVWWEDRSGCPAHLAGKEHLRESWLDEVFELAPPAFLQVNRQAAEELQRWVVDQALTTGARSAVDAYAGVAVFGRHLAREGLDVVSIELDEGAVRASRRDPPSRLKVLQGRVEDLLPTVLPTDLVIANPPRSGLDASVRRELVESGPGTVIYVSCSPATLARDLEELSVRYEISAIRAQDLFPRTAHVEAALVLSRRGSAASVDLETD